MSNARLGTDLYYVSSKHSTIKIRVMFRWNPNGGKDDLRVLYQL